MQAAAILVKRGRRMTAQDDIKARWMFTEYWGAPPELSLSDQENLDFGRALIMAANGDGRLTDAEKDWILGYVATGGHSEETLEKLRAFDGTADFEDLFTRGIQRMAQRVCIYDAIRACGADGDLHPDEIATVRSMAARLGVPDEVVDEFIALYKEEQDLKARRVQAVFPGGF
jgi:uncharacterized membrane protein YebE (DUF533 family)